MNLKRLALLTTVKEDAAMAAPANIGFNNIPINGYKIPSAIGIPMIL